VLRVGAKALQATAVTLEEAESCMEQVDGALTSQREVQDTLGERAAEASGRLGYKYSLLAQCLRAEIWMTITADVGLSCGSKFSSGPKRGGSFTQGRLENVSPYDLETLGWLFTLT
jgi:hypothetical protein